MHVTEKAARLVGRRFRRAAWVFGFIALALLGYAGAYLVAVLASIELWGVFQLAAFVLERVGGIGKSGTA